MNPLPGEYNTEHLLRMHHYIFQDLYEWAGEPRIIAIYKEEDVLGGMSVEYSDPFDIVKDIHNILQICEESLGKIWIESVQQSNFAILWQDYGKYILSGRKHQNNDNIFLPIC